VCAAAIAIVAAGALPSTAGAASTIQPLRTGPLPTPVLTKPFRDRVITHPSRRARARAAALTASERPYPTPDGFTIQVGVSPSYPDSPQTQAAVQGVVNFVASRIHGPEIARLHMLVAKPDEIHVQCGAQEAVACYFPGEQRMYVPGERDPSGIPTEYVITHEYGHHIATFRKNAIDDAFLIGPEYWATYEHVCSGVLGGRYFPGDQGSHYLDNPGEGWADSYAHLPEHYPNFPFQFNAGFIRDQGAFDAIHKDITQPWAGPTDKTFSSSSGRRTQRFTQTVTLDGPVVAKVRGRRGAKYALVGKALGTTVRSRKVGSRVGIHPLLCRGAGDASADVTLRVARRAGAGKFTLSVRYAG
jgi:hypothetical protein